jgi:putative component of toxin-antitoxin plasmid stabilization module
VVKQAAKVMNTQARAFFEDYSKQLREQSTRAHEQIGERLRRLYQP